MISDGSDRTMLTAFRGLWRAASSRSSQPLLSILDHMIGAVSTDPTVSYSPVRGFKTSLAPVEGLIR